LDTEYKFEDLEEILYDIKKTGEGDLNIPKAFYCLMKEIYNLRLKLEYIHALIPLKYKKSFPKNGENPYFGIKDLGLDQVDVEEFKKAKERMENLLNKTKPKI